MSKSSEYQAAAAKPAAFQGIRLDGPIAGKKHCP